ncbi:hypothetical protein AB3662_44820 [Sorangium cellulosum]|uniref:hypothetical protein n=1 Tax=Sorangium cellulosum TaxID=56 RepID=UPI003D9A672D
MPTRVPAGHRVTVFIHPSFGGEARVFTSDTDLVATGFDNTLSSLDKSQFDHRRKQ